MLIDFDVIPDDGEWLLDCVESRDHFKVDPEEGVLKTDVHVNGSLSKIGLEVDFKGSISTEMEMECSRCLEPLVFPVRTKVVSRYIPGMEDGNPNSEVELNASDIEVEVYSEGRVDLTQAVYDQMMLSLPLARFCREDCKGICSQCGINRNKESCKCAGQDSTDPRLDVLKTLKDKLK